MSLMLDQKYASMIGPFLRNFSRKNSGTCNFSCVFCGDSKTITSKARGYLYPKGDRLMFKCHNCGEPHSFYDLLLLVDPNLHSEYVKERFMERKEQHPEEKIFPKPKFTNQLDKDLVKISSLAPQHVAKKYVMDRMIPTSLHYQLFYVKNFKKWVNKLRPNTFKPELLKFDEERLVIPLIDRHNNVMGYQGRSLIPSHPLKYITVLLQEDNSKVYGLDRCDINKIIPVLEGPIDAMFIPNAIAATGGRIDTSLQAAGVTKDKAIIIYDNEPRNKHTIKKMEQAVNNGYSICIWPPDIKQTDINKMILAGYNVSQITDIIKENTFSGLNATMQINIWKRV